MNATLLCCALPVLLTAGAATLVVPVPTSVQEPAAAADDAAASNDEQLDEVMKSINKNYRVVRLFLRKPEGDAPLESVYEMQQACMTAKGLKPSIFEKVPAERREEFVTEYKKSMNQFLRTMLDMEDAMLVKDWEGA